MQLHVRKRENERGNHRGKWGFENIRYMVQKGMGMGRKGGSMGSWEAEEPARSWISLLYPQRSLSNSPISLSSFFKLKRTHLVLEAPSPSQSLFHPLQTSHPLLPLLCKPWS